MSSTHLPIISSASSSVFCFAPADRKHAIGMIEDAVAHPATKESHRSPGKRSSLNTCVALDADVWRLALSQLVVAQGTVVVLWSFGG
jgi:hypothetical protein